MKRLIVGMLMAFPLAASAQYAGKVFVDVNHNGRWDKGETLVKDVSVSDGLNVVKTDAKGGEGGQQEQPHHPLNGPTDQTAAEGGRIPLSV